MILTLSYYITVIFYILIKVAEKAAKFQNLEGELGKNTYINLLWKNLDVNE